MIHIDIWYAHFYEKIIITLYFQQSWLFWKPETGSDRNRICVNTAISLCANMPDKNRLQTYSVATRFLLGSNLIRIATELLIHTCSLQPKTNRIETKPNKCDVRLTWKLLYAWFFFNLQKYWIFNNLFRLILNISR